MKLFFGDYIVDSRKRDRVVELVIDDSSSSIYIPKHQNPEISPIASFASEQNDSEQLRRENTELRTQVANLTFQLSVANELNTNSQRELAKKMQEIEALKLQLTSQPHPQNVVASVDIGVSADPRLFPNTENVVVEKNKRRKKYQKATNEKLEEIKAIIRHDDVMSMSDVASRTGIKLAELNVIMNHARLTFTQVKLEKVSDDNIRKVYKESNSVFEAAIKLRVPYNGLSNYLTDYRPELVKNLEYPARKSAK